ncbi:unnamed protein product [Periconia digitata]|uniref:Uncharacterized protein n=1 Tax=Periconia digitata TaxID=1303443 RepID=A0A9W4USU4_9PLEO|nr:unnamed protein product [Periconia digitata]
MWCQNCGKGRSHYHSMGSAKANYCQRCRSRGTQTPTYCKFCGVNRLEYSSTCDAHYGNSISNPASPTYSSDDDASSDGAGYATDLSSPSLSPSPSPPASVEERVQCSHCELWFSSEFEKEYHLDRNTSGCSEHKECFPSSQEYAHAKEHWHNKCFVPGCDEDWEMEDEDVVEHVWEEHTARG